MGVQRLQQSCRLHILCSWWCSSRRSWGRWGSPPGLVWAHNVLVPPFMAWNSKRAVNFVHWLLRNRTNCRIVLFLALPLHIRCKPNTQHARLLTSVRTTVVHYHNTKLRHAPMFSYLQPTNDSSPDARNNHNIGNDKLSIFVFLL